LAVELDVLESRRLRLLYFLQVRLLGENLAVFLLTAKASKKKVKSIILVKTV
jgi:hypothetical protein